MSTKKIEFERLFSEKFSKIKPSTRHRAWTNFWSMFGNQKDTFYRRSVYKLDNASPKGPSNIIGFPVILLRQIVTEGALLFVRGLKLIPRFCSYCAKTYRRKFRGEAMTDADRYGVRENDKRDKKDLYQYKTFVDLINFLVYSGFDFEKCTSGSQSNAEFLFKNVFEPYRKRQEKTFLFECDRLEIIISQAYGISKAYGRKKSTIKSYLEEGTHLAKILDQCKNEAERAKCAYDLKLARNKLTNIKAEHSRELDALLDKINYALIDYHGLDTALILKSTLDGEPYELVPIKKGADTINEACLKYLKRRKLRLQCIMVAYYCSLALGFGECLVPGVGMFRYLMNAGVANKVILGISLVNLPLAVAIFAAVCGFYTNKILVEKDIVEVGYLIFSGKIFIDKDGQKVTGLKKFVLCLFGSLSFFTGLCYSALAATRLYTIIFAFLCSAGIHVASAYLLAACFLIFPIGPFIGMSCFLAVSIITFIRDKKWNGIGTFFKLTFVDPPWKAMSKTECAIQVLECSFTIIKALAVVSIVIIVALAGLVLFQKSIMEAVKDIFSSESYSGLMKGIGASRADAVTLSYVATGANITSTSILGVDKLAKWASNMTFRACVSAIPKLPIFFIELIVSILTLRLFRAPFGLTGKFDHKIDKFFHGSIYEKPTSPPTEDTAHGKSSADIKTALEDERTRATIACAANGGGQGATSANQGAVAVDSKLHIGHPAATIVTLACATIFSTGPNKQAAERATKSKYMATTGGETELVVEKGIYQHIDDKVFGFFKHFHCVGLTLAEKHGHSQPAPVEEWDSLASAGF